MADYFIHFSCVLDVGTPDNATCVLDIHRDLDVELQAGGDPHA